MQEVWQRSEQESTKGKQQGTRQECVHKSSKILGKERWLKITRNHSGREGMHVAWNMAKHVESSTKPGQKYG